MAQRQRAKTKEQVRVGQTHARPTISSSSLLAVLQALRAGYPFVLSNMRPASLPYQAAYKRHCHIQHEPQ